MRRAGIKSYPASYKFVKIKKYPHRGGVGYAQIDIISSNSSITLAALTHHK
jgi:hypothetical protein